jgi:hypothetical protein
MRGVVLAVLALLTLARPVHANERAVIDQVVLEPSSLGGQRLKIYLSALTLQGQVLEVGEAGTPRVLIGGAKSASPYAIGTYSATQSDTAIVIVVQTSADFTEVLPVIGEAIDSQVLANANERTQVAVLTYGEALGVGKLGSLRGGRARVTTLQSDGSVNEPALLDSIERALVLLKKAATKPEGRPLRKMIVVIGDGRDASNDRDRVVRVGNRALKDNVRIHSMAYSPKDVRRPLLLLGELSKRSLGTFRWVRGGRTDSWTPASAQLGTELTKQTVITVFAPADEDLVGKKVKVQLVGRAELLSLNEVKIPALSCNAAVCEAGMYCAADACIAPREAAHRGVLGWILLIGGIAVGGMVVLGLIGFVMTKRQQLVAQVGDTSPVQNMVGRATAMPQLSSQPPKTMALVPGSTGVATAPATTGTPRLQVISGPYAGRELPLKHGFFVGKTTGCDLLLDDGYTSGHHAQFVMDGASVKLFDYGSTNGTFVNGERITTCTLSHGSMIKIGSTEMRFLAQ